MYLQLSIVSSGTQVDSIQITVGEKNRPLISCLIEKDQLLEYFHLSGDPNSQEGRVKISGRRSSKADQKILEEISAGLEKFAPEIIEEGVNGTYFLRNEAGEIAAVFKPEDEEGESESNPKHESEGEELDLSKGLAQGEGVLREVAAYLLDHEHFSGVPETRLVEIERFRGEETVKGSLQEFVPNDGASWDIGPKQFPINEVHKIGILDLRIFNADRHGGNILLKKDDHGLYSLIPIDHGFSMTEKLDKAWFDWMSFPQAKSAFDQKSLEYIAALDIESDARILANLGIRKECIRTMKISTTLLKKGARMGLNLYQIGSIASQMIYGQTSVLENLFTQALNSLGLDQGQLADEDVETLFLNELYRSMDEIFASGHY